MAQYSVINFTLNGRKVEKVVDVRASLTDMLRNDFSLTSVKKGCEVGECGACNVIIDGECYNSCLYLAVWADGKNIRTLESLYYLGVSCIEKGAPEPVGQWAPYEREYPYTTAEALQALCTWLEKSGLQELRTSTRIIIVPGFRFSIADMLVTNFHQSESTLLLLVSAFVGGDWRTIYDYALTHGFRFLSYGDSSLLVRADNN